MNIIDNSKIMCIINHYKRDTWAISGDHLESGGSIPTITLQPSNSREVSDGKP